MAEKYEQLGRVADYNAVRMMSPKPAVRREATATFMSAIDRQLKIIGLLGHQRRQRDVSTMSAREYQDHIEHGGTDDAHASPTDDQTD